MKYFGEKSLSSLISIILHVSWYIVLTLTSITILLGVLSIFSKETRDLISSDILRSIPDMNINDSHDFKAFLDLPLALRFYIVPYYTIFVIILLQIIKKSQQLFTNFKKDIVFSNNNALIIMKISKLNIVFSVITLNFTLLLVSILLRMLCEIFKKGSYLQEEHDFTV